MDSQVSILVPSYQQPCFKYVNMYNTMLINISKFESIRVVVCYPSNEGPVRIQYKCLVPIYVFPEIQLLFPKQNYNVLSSNSYTHISMGELYISRISLPILLQKYVD
jgi:hypothetical protein